MLLNSIFLFIIQINYSLCFWKNSKKTLEDYTIDIFFTNTLTIIRCNPSERHVLRDITIEAIGHIKCSNWQSFLPDDQIEYITLLEWLYTTIKCDKKKLKIKEEKTYFEIKHKAKNAFKKNPLKLIRVGSTDSSELHWKDDDFQLYFKHPPRKLSINKTEQTEDDFLVDIYSFKGRPILCRERYIPAQQPCSDDNQHQNVSYICYYKVGVAEPPTVAEMEKEIKTLPHDINLDENSIVDLYMNKKPKKKSSGNILFMIIIGSSIIIFIIAGMSVYCCCCGGQSENEKKIQRINSNTSTISNSS
ncbi:unnamed protein product [Rotaria magnacalcarata]|uniref:Uncharacterized protein n=1 Tax=Rotaria magnacalcarata TaxID=392030 RepID=A0A815DU67_9BILA|nr:unnamed protein product [Rotaria magnacalcarata]